MDQQKMPETARETATHELMNLWTGGLKEWLRASSTMGQVAIDVTHEAHVAALRWQMAWPAVLRDTIGWYERAVRETIENTRTVVELMGAAGTVMTEFTARVTASAETARHQIEDAFLEVEPPTRRRQAA
jgi:hypothetical protein